MAIVFVGLAWGKIVFVVLGLHFLHLLLFLLTFPSLFFLCVIKSTPELVLVSFCGDSLPRLILGINLKAFGNSFIFSAFFLSFLSTLILPFPIFFLV